jgi:hypothetical protein
VYGRQFSSPRTPIGWPAGHRVREIDLVTVAGKTEPIRVYELLGPAGASRRRTRVARAVQRRPRRVPGGRLGPGGAAVPDMPGLRPATGRRRSSSSGSPSCARARLRCLGRGVADGRSSVRKSGHGRSPVAALRSAHAPGDRRRDRRGSRCPGRRAANPALRRELEEVRGAAEALRRDYPESAWPTWRASSRS